MTEDSSRWDEDIALLQESLYQVFTNDFDGAEVTFKTVSALAFVGTLLN